MTRIAAAVSAGLLVAMAVWLGCTAIAFLSFDASELHLRAAEVQLHVNTYVDHVFHQALVRAMLALAAILPVPALIRLLG